MDIIISNSSGVPIYEQIVRQLKGLILSGALPEGEALPSMRALAKDLHLSVITVQRAYEDLTRDGFIETVSGKGSLLPLRTWILSGKNSCGQRRSFCGRPRKSAGHIGIGYESWPGFLKNVLRRMSRKTATSRWFPHVPEAPALRQNYIGGLVYGRK